MSKQFRIRKYLRNKYNISDNDLDWYMMQKHHLDHKPTREELFKLEPVFITYEHNILRH